MYCKIPISPEDHTRDSHQQKSPGGVVGGLSAVTLPFLQLKLGRRVSGDPPLSLLKRKKEAKKKRVRVSPVLYGNVSHEDYTRNCHNRFLSTKLPRRGEQAAAAAVTLPFSLLKLGRRVSGGLLSLGKSAVAISAGRRAAPPLAAKNGDATKL